MTPRVSVVVLAYRNSALTERCLESFLATTGDEAEIVVVDNGCPEDSAALVERWKDRDRVTAVSLPENRNFSGGNNEGARLARGDVLIFLNNDTVLLPGAVEALAQQALEPGVGVVGPRLSYPHGALQHGGFGWRRAADGTLPGFHWFHHEPAELPAAASVYDLDVVTGACVAMRREVFEELGGWDEAFVNGAEDTDLCIKARIAGYRVVYRGDAHVLHDEGMATKGAYGRDGNTDLLQSRYGGMMDDDSDRLATLFDARFNHHADGATASPGLPGGLSIEGQVSGLMPEAAEARALIACLTGAGAAVSARDWAPTWIVPKLSDSEWQPVLAARTRPKAPGTGVVHVPGGSAYAVPEGVAVLRAGSLPAALPGGTRVWAASPSLVDDFVAAGVDRSRVDYLPPVISGQGTGDGGQGILALLPAHDLNACAELLRKLPNDVRVRVLPSVSSPPLLDLIGERELLAPITSELRLQALAREADLVIDLDPADTFGRRALNAAAAGAAVVIAGDGAAAAVLGDLADTSIEAALERTGDRVERAARVADECAPGRLFEQFAAQPA